MIANEITTNDVPIACPKQCFKQPVCSLDTPARGVMIRINLSRIEEGLGHEGYRCDRCGHTIKRVPERT
jgi:hypothetical protein